MMKLSSNQGKLKQVGLARRFVALLVLLCQFSCLLLLSGCNAAETGNGGDTSKIELLEPVNVTLDTITVTKSDIFSVITYDAIIEPKMEELSFDIMGTIENINVHPGEEVVKGQVLATLETEDMNERLLDMREELEDMKAAHNYELQKLTYQIEIDEESRYFTTNQKIKADHYYIEEEKLILKQKMEQYALEETHMQKRIDDIAGDVQKYQLTAPFSGRIVAVADMNKGDMIKANSSILKMISSEQDEYILACAYFPEAIVNSSHRVYAVIHGKEYDVTNQPYSKDELAKLRSSDQNIKSNFIIHQMGEDVKLGDYALLCLIRDYSENVLAIPRDALFYDGSGYYVYLVENETKIRQAVSVGKTTTTMAEIKEGLKEGDVIYVKN